MSISSTAEEGARHKLQMDRMYRVQRHFYDATRAYYLLGRDAMIEALSPPQGGSVLEIGCGTGRNLAKIAGLYPDARLHGLDISDEMLISAGNSLRKAGLFGRIVLAQGDAVTFTGAATFSTPSFDRICFSYALSMIPDWQAALGNAAGHLSPGGELHVVDFGPCQGLPAAFGVALKAWLSRFHVTPRLELAEVALRLAESHGLEFLHRHSHKGYAQHLTLRRPS